MRGSALAAFFVSSLVVAFGPACSSSTGGSGGSGDCVTTNTSAHCVMTDYGDSSVTCASVGGTSGMCPTAGLVGCCTTVSMNGTDTLTVASCFYSGDAATMQSSCTGDDGGKWSTTL